MYIVIFQYITENVVIPLIISYILSMQSRIFALLMDVLFFYTLKSIIGMFIILLSNVFQYIIENVLIPLVISIISGIFVELFITLLSKKVVKLNTCKSSGYKKSIFTKTLDLKNLYFAR